MNAHSPAPPHPYSASALPQSLDDVAPSLMSLLTAARGSIDKDNDAAKKSLARARTLLEVAMARAGTKPSANKGELATWRVQLLNAYIERYLEEEIKVEHLSVLVDLSRNHFSTIFKRTFGETPYGYITRRRVKLASYLLLTTNDDLKKIAQACGFFDQSHLCRRFRRHYGVSPCRWRRGQPKAVPSDMRSTPALGAESASASRQTPRAPLQISSGNEQEQRVGAIRMAAHKASFPGR